jgi:hypothetical protein
MFLIYKNKGILIPVYIFVSLMSAAIIGNILTHEFAVECNETIFVGFGVTVSGIWSYITRDSYYIVQGQRRQMNEDNSFFFLSMRIWAYLLFIAGLSITCYGIAATLEFV